MHAFELPHLQTPPTQLSAPVGLQVVHIAPAAPHAVVGIGTVLTHVLPWQQPPGQLVESHTQLPFEQRLPAPHAAFAPHLQVPFAQVSAVVELQAVHAAPPAPQTGALWLMKAVHVVPVQQPPAQDVASQMQLPAAQRWPTAHCALPPHLHVPPLQLSARAASQLVHTPPSVPHAPDDAAWQVPFWQQPFGHDAESHTQLPVALHRWPGAQAAVEPHLQAPAVHALDTVALQVAHSAPLVPQRSVVGGITHTPFEQHPLAQLPALQPEHACPVHVCGEGQLWQSRPPTPHAVVAVPLSHTLPLQQPVHVELSHTHWPPEHRCVGAHAGPVPQRQAPFAHASARVGLHALHTPPSAPHAERVAVTHWPFSQHPFGQLAGLHTQAPLLHCWPTAHSGFLPH